MSFATLQDFRDNLAHMGLTDAYDPDAPDLDTQVYRADPGFSTEIMGRINSDSGKIGLGNSMGRQNVEHDNEKRKQETANYIASIVSKEIAANRAYMDDLMGKIAQNDIRIGEIDDWLRTHLGEDTANQLAQLSDEQARLQFELDQTEPNIEAAQVKHQDCERQQQQIENRAIRLDSETNRVFIPDAAGENYQVYTLASGARPTLVAIGSVERDAITEDMAHGYLDQAGAVVFIDRESGEEIESDLTTTEVRVIAEEAQTQQLDTPSEDEYRDARAQTEEAASARDALTVEQVRLLQGIELIQTQIAQLTGGDPEVHAMVAERTSERVEQLGHRAELAIAQEYEQELLTYSSQLDDFKYGIFTGDAVDLNAIYGNILNNMPVDFSNHLKNMTKSVTEQKLTELTCQPTDGDINFEELSAQTGSLTTYLEGLQSQAWSLGEMFREMPGFLRSQFFSPAEEYRTSLEERLRQELDQANEHFYALNDQRGELYRDIIEEHGLSPDDFMISVISDSDGLMPVSGPIGMHNLNAGIFPQQNYVEYGIIERDVTNGERIRIPLTPEQQDRLVVLEAEMSIAEFQKSRAAESLMAQRHRSAEQAAEAFEEPTTERVVANPSDIGDDLEIQSAFNDASKGETPSAEDIDPGLSHTQIVYRSEVPAGMAM